MELLFTVKCLKNTDCWLCFMFDVCLNIFLCIFSQLRAQNQVLKKAVVDEQANSTSLKVK